MRLQFAFFPSRSCKNILRKVNKKYEKDSKLKVIFLLAIPDIEEKDDDILVKIYDEIIAISKDKQVVENIAKVKNYRELLLYFIKQDNVFN